MAETSVSVRPSTVPSDPDIAVDRIGGVDYQIIKPVWGAVDSATHIADTNAARLPVGGSTLGNPDDAAAGTDTATSGLVGLTKRLLQHLTTMIGSLASMVANDAAATAVDAGVGSDDEAIVGAAAGQRLVGFACYETTGLAGATVILHNGTSNSDPAIYCFTLAAGESRAEWFGKGIASAGGIWLERVSGSCRFVGLHRTAS